MGETPKTIVTWSNANNSLRFICNSICIDENNFFEQFKMSEKYFNEQSEEQHNISLGECRLPDFKYFKELIIEFDNLLIVIELSFSLPGSNASVERLFSIMNST